MDPVRPQRGVPDLGPLQFRMIEISEAVCQAWPFVAWLEASLLLSLSNERLGFLKCQSSPTSTLAYFYV